MGIDLRVLRRLRNYICFPMRKLPEQDAHQSAKTIERNIQQLESPARDKKLVKFITQRVETGEEENQA